MVTNKILIKNFPYQLLIFLIILVHINHYGKYVAYFNLFFFPVGRGLGMEMQGKSCIKVQLEATLKNCFHIMLLLNVHHLISTIVVKPVKAIKILLILVIFSYYSLSSNVLICAEIYHTICYQETCPLG